LPPSFIGNFTMVRAGHANGGAVPKESQLENEGIVRGTIYVVIQICTKYPFFVKPTVSMRNGQTNFLDVGVYIVMVCTWTYHILGKNSAS